MGVEYFSFKCNGAASSSLGCVQPSHLSCKCTTCVVYVSMTLAATEPDPHTNSQQASAVLLMHSIKVSLDRMCWCRGAVFVWAGGSVLVGGGCKVVIYVDTRTRKALIQSHQLLGPSHSSQRMCQQLREVSATWRGLASAVFHSLAPHIMSRYVFRCSLRLHV